MAPNKKFKKTNTKAKSPASLKVNPPRALSGPLQWYVPFIFQNSSTVENTNQVSINTWSQYISLEINVFRNYIDWNLINDFLARLKYSKISNDPGKGHEGP